MDADHPGPEERLGIEDRAIDVGFRGEVQDGVRIHDERRHDVGIADVAAHEAVARRLLRIAQ